MSNLLQKASIVTTPTAYGVGVLNSIKPAIPFGEELISNGSFNNGSTGWTIINGTVTDKYNASMTAYQSGIRIVPFAYTGTFKVVFDLVVTSGSCKFDAGGGNDEIYTTSGTKEKIITNPTKFEFNAFNLGWVGTLDNVSVKEMIDADFDFTRTSSATRVNPDYLLETVSINGSELVQNGNFSELGSEIITNGNFETDSDWSKDSNWSISGGSANADGTSSNNISQPSVIPTIGETYKITFEVLSISQGYFQARLGNELGVQANNVGVYTSYVTATNTDRIRIYAKSSAIGSIDKVSVKQVDPNDYWDLGTGWSFGDGKVIGNGTSFTYITQSTVAIQNKKVKLTFDILDYVSGTFRLLPSDRQDGLDERFSGNGSYEVIYTSTVNLFRLQQQAFNGSITNISIIELQENGVPRLDYTNGTASILLENQSTNLLNYSNDFSNSDWTKQSGVTATYNTTETLSPDGTYNATKLIGNGTTGIFDSVTVSGVVSRSIYIKSVTGNVNVILKDPQNTVTQKTLNVTTQWQRFELVEDNTISSQGLWVDDIPSSGIYIYGAQIESQSYTTSYIPTDGSSVTRAAETLTNAGNSDLINSTEGVLYADISALANDGTNRAISISDGTTSNVVRFYYSTTDNRIVGNVKSGGSSVFNFNNVLSNAVDFIKLAIKYKANDFKMYVNGVEVSTDTSGAAPIGLKELAFDNGAGNDNFFGRCKTVAVFKEALSDTELACLTSTNNREIFLNYYYRMQYVGANTEALSCAEQTFNI
jgi:hypothetical protein